MAENYETQWGWAPDVKKPYAGHDISEALLQLKLRDREIAELREKLERTVEERDALAALMADDLYVQEADARSEAAEARVEELEEEVQHTLASYKTQALLNGGFIDRIKNLESRLAALIQAGEPLVEHAECEWVAGLVPTHKLKTLAAALEQAKEKKNG